MTKSGREIMEIFEAFDLTGTAWSAAPAGGRGGEGGLARGPAPPLQAVGPEPGMWLHWDWGDGPPIGGRKTVLFSAWLAWSRFRVVTPAWDQQLGTLTWCMDQALRAIGGAPTYLLPDYVARNIIRHDHPEHPGEELPGVLAAGDDLLQRHRERQVHEHVPGKARREHQRPQLAPPALARRDQPQVPEIDLQLAARRPVITGVVTLPPPAPHRSAANRCSVRSATTTPCRASKIPIFTTGTPPA